MVMSPVSETTPVNDVNILAPAADMESYDAIWRHLSSEMVRELFTELRIKTNAKSRDEYLSTLSTSDLTVLALDTMAPAAPLAVLWDLHGIGSFQSAAVQGRAFEMLMGRCTGEPEYYETLRTAHKRIGQDRDAMVSLYTFVSHVDLGIGIDESLAYLSQHSTTAATPENLKYLLQERMADEMYDEYRHSSLDNALQALDQYMRGQEHSESWLEMMDAMRYGRAQTVAELVDIYATRANLGDPYSRSVRAQVIPTMIADIQRYVESAASKRPSTGRRDDITRSELVSLLAALTQILTWNVEFLAKETSQDRRSARDDDSDLRAESRRGNGRIRDIEGMTVEEILRSRRR